jgi:uroporphyrinogen III methyltransferase / synthase
MTVYLVGAGPGDPGLLTARALELIAAADVIVHDRLIPSEALEHAAPGAELIYAGKEGGAESVSQAETEQLLIERGRDPAKTVVRLKGGDPFVFGRGGEEVEALSAAGIAFEVVPGVTAGVAAPAAAGIPVTHRELASAVAFVTGHEDPDKPESALDWDALASFPGTLVVYMGIRQLESIARRLIAAGRDPEQPAALIERGTLPDQRVLTGTLGTVSMLGARPPTIAVFGNVVALRQRLRLAGVTVAVTRARAQASGLAARLRGLGAAVVEAPAIRIEPLGGPAPELGRYDLVCLTSPNGVRILFDRLQEAGRDARAFAGSTVAAIGPGTAAALREHGIVADVIPGRSTAEGLLDALAGRPARPWEGGRALVARAKQARDALPDGLGERGAEVDVLPLYETVAESLLDAQVDAVLAADYVTFTSSSTVTRLLEATGDRRPDHARLVSIGPVTSATLREHGLEPDAEAASHDIDGLVAALLADVGSRVS